MEEIIEWFSQVFWTFLRIGGFLMVVPVFGNQLVPRRIRAALAMVISVAIAPMMPHDLPVLSDFDLGVLLQGALQLFAGITLGFAAVMFFQLFIIAGQFIGMQMGLGFAAMVDPGNGVQVTVWSQFFLMLVTLLFISMNGHLVLLEVLVLGFSEYKFGVSIPLSELAGEIVRFGGWMFVGGALVALPAVVSLLVVNLSFGVMSRAAPQLNVFSLGFPFSLVFGLAVMWMSLSGWLPQFERLAGELFHQVSIWTS